MCTASRPVQDFTIADNIKYVQVYAIAVKQFLHYSRDMSEVGLHALVLSHAARVLRPVLGDFVRVAVACATRRLTIDHAWTYVISLSQGNLKVGQEAYDISVITEGVFHVKGVMHCYHCNQVSTMPVCQ